MPQLRKGLAMGRTNFLVPPMKSASVLLNELLDAPCPVQLLH